MNKTSNVTKRLKGNTTILTSVERTLITTVCIDRTTVQSQLLMFPSILYVQIGMVPPVSTSIPNFFRDVL